MLINKTYIKAFSLIELLIAVALVAIISLVTMPVLRGIIGKNHTLTYANELLTMLQFTRSTAIKFGKSVVFCGSKDHKTCNDSWQNGSIVVTTEGKVMRILPSVSAGDKLTWHGGFNTKNIITFLPMGFPNGQQGSFYYCPQNSSEHALSVILSSTGRVRIANKTADEKIIPCNF